MNVDRDRAVQDQVASSRRDAEQHKSCATCSGSTSGFGDRIYHCGDSTFLKNIRLEDALQECGDSRGATCTDYTSGSRSGRRFAAPSKRWAETLTRTGRGSPPLPQAPARLRHAVGGFLTESRQLGCALLADLLWMVSSTWLAGPPFITSFWRQDSVTGPSSKRGLTTIRSCAGGGLRTIAIRTVGIRWRSRHRHVLAIPIAYYRAHPSSRFGSCSSRSCSLWSSTWFGSYAWRTISP